MKKYFYDLAEKLTDCCEKNQVLLLEINAEDSQFIRFNNSLIRQAGAVKQAYLNIELIEGSRHVSESITLTGDLETDLDRCDIALSNIKASLPSSPEDPFLTYSTEVENSEQIGENKLPEIEAVTDAILNAGRDKDLVGIFAQGSISKGFANSLGQRNWFETYSFNFDWCFYVDKDKAIKCNYSDFAWDQKEFETKVQVATEQAEVLNQPAKTIDPGEYRVYLSPAALGEFVEMLNWGAFSLKEVKTKSTPLVRMTESGEMLSPKVTMLENTADGLSPNFTGSGYTKPDRVVLIENGKHKDSLVSPRSAAEFGVEVNAGVEAAQSFELEPGDIPSDEILEKLGTGIYCNTLWYLNYSDRPAGRITGMTRFATFWVENGKIVAPLNVMRFDETVYRALGENLIGLTKHQDFMPSCGTYAERSTASTRLPGALIDNFRFTL